MSNDSILDSTKKLLGVDKDYDAFDLDIITHINSTFATLHQLGVGPEEGFYIEDADKTWVSYLGDNKHIMSVKSYMNLKVRLLFDPPATSFGIEAMKKQAEEFEWRLNVAVDTRPVVEPEEDLDLPWFYDDPWRDSNSL